MSGIVGKNLGRGSGVVTATPVGADTVSGANIADDAIDSEHYAATSIDTAHIATNQIDETLMKDAFVGDFTDATVTASDYFLHGDATDSGNTKKDTVQGILDLAGSGGAWNIIQTQDISDDATIDFTGINTTYDCYVFIGSDIRPATSAQIFKVRLGDSGGFDSGASDYAYHNTKLPESGAGYASSISGGDTDIHVGQAMGADALDGLSFELWLNRPSDGSSHPIVRINHVELNANPTMYFGQTGGYRQADIVCDRVQFFFPSGNLATGRITMYGVAHA